MRRGVLIMYGFLTFSIVYGVAITYRYHGDEIARVVKAIAR